MSSVKLRLKTHKITIHTSAQLSTRLNSSDVICIDAPSLPDSFAYSAWIPI